MTFVITNNSTPATNIQSRIKYDEEIEGDIEILQNDISFKIVPGLGSEEEASFWSTAFHSEQKRSDNLEI